MTSDHLKAWRSQLGWSQGKLARVLRVHKRTISAWEHGRQASPPFLHLALAVAPADFQSFHGGFL